MISKVIRLYEDREDVTLTTYVVEDSEEMLKGGNRPAVLICPGGAYLNCSDREAEPVALRFAAMGYHTFVLRYSVFFEGKPPVLERKELKKPKDHCIHPNPIREIAKSFLILREHAQEWKIDMEKIAICGFSAGAHNCAMYSVYWDKPIITDYFKEGPEVFRPAATILAYTLSDYSIMKQIKEGFAKQLFELSNLALTGTTHPDDKTLQEMSPAHLVTKNTPPMFLWATAEDGLVKAEHTLQMALALAKENIPYEVHIFETGDHGLSLANQASAGSLGQINEDVSKWVSLCECWLKKRFALKFLEKVE